MRGSRTFMYWAQKDHIGDTDIEDAKRICNNFTEIVTNNVCLYVYKFILRLKLKMMYLSTLNCHSKLNTVLFQNLIS